MILNSGLVFLATLYKTRPSLVPINNVSYQFFGPLDFQLFLTFALPLSFHFLALLLSTLFPLPRHKHTTQQHKRKLNTPTTRQTNWNLAANSYTQIQWIDRLLWKFDEIILKIRQNNHIRNCRRKNPLSLPKEILIHFIQHHMQRFKILRLTQFP